MHGSFSETMAAAKAVAVEARSRGEFVGKSAPGWNVKRRPDPERGSWEMLVSQTRATWQAQVSQARADFDWHVRLQFVFIDGVGNVPF